MANANSDRRLYDAMIVLKRHLNSCTQCHGARKANDEYGMCPDGLRLVLRAADRYDHLITLRAKALKNVTGVVFACPDLSRHGRSYALAALPLQVTGIQDRMF